MDQQQRKRTAVFQSQRRFSKNTRKPSSPSDTSFSPSSSRRSKVLLNQALQRAHNRTQSRIKKRSNRLAGRRSIYASIAAMQSNTVRLPLGKQLYSYSLALVLLPFCVISTFALFMLTGEVNMQNDAFWINLFKTKSFFGFLIGFLLMKAWFFVKEVQHFLLYAYVLGHELTHALFVYLSFGKVTEMKVSHEGGYILSNKHNVWISLSPYFVPFWAVALALPLLLLRLFWDFPLSEQLIYLVLGAGWFFHLLWTLWMIPQEQPDLQEHGTLFSLSFIYLINVWVLSFMLCMAMGWDGIMLYLKNWLIIGEKILDWSFVFLNL